MKRQVMKLNPSTRELILTQSKIMSTEVLPVIGYELHTFSGGETHIRFEST